MSEEYSILGEWVVPPGARFAGVTEGAAWFSVGDLVYRCSVDTAGHTHVEVFR